MAAAYPESTIMAVSNSNSQRLYIEAQAQARGLMNITVMTEDMNTFEPDGQFDRVVSIEMFEHMRNYERLFDQISSCVGGGWLIVFPYFLSSKSTVLF